MSIKDTVFAWFNDRLANGAIARDTEAYNQAFTALNDLVARLDPPAPEPTPEPPADSAPPA